MPVVKLSPEGLHRLPRSGPAIVAVNHTSVVDAFHVLTALYKGGLLPNEPCGKPDCGLAHGHVRFMATSRLFAAPVLGPLVRRWGMIEVPWAAPAAGALRSALRALGRNEIVGIYPEGDVNAATDGSPRRFRPGVAAMAISCGVPIYPVAHHDVRRVGSGSVARSLGGALTSIVRRPTVRLEVGEPVQPHEFTGLSVRDVVDLVQERVTDVWRSISGESSPRLETREPERRCERPSSPGTVAAGCRNFR